MSDPSYRQAEALVGQGALAQAEGVLDAVLARDADHVPALRLRGKLHLHLGRPGPARALLERAAALAPADGEIAFEAGVAALGQNDWDAAAVLLRRGLVLAPAHAGILFNLAWALRRLGDDAEAAELLRRLLERAPGHAAAWFNLGNALSELGRFNEAAGAFRQAAATGWPPSEALAGLGLACLRGGDAATARALADELTAHDPEHPAGRGLALEVAMADGDEARVLDLAEVILRHTPNDAGALLRRAQVARKRADAAAIRRELAAAAAPEIPAEVLAEWADAARAAGLAEAMAAAELAAERAPRSLPVQSVLGKIQALAGRWHDAQATFRRCLDRDPGNWGMHSNYLFASLHDGALTPEEVFRRHAAYGQAWEGRFPQPLARVDDPDPDRVLRIGYVSPDFCEHAVAFFVEHLLAGRDRAAFQVHCYHLPRRRDAVTERLRALADHWREIDGPDPVATALESIRADGIDILVDLAGHSSGNLLPVFAAKAAPVQMTMIGYPATTGLTRMDYRIAAGGGVFRMGEPRWHTERLLTLQSGLPFTPPENAPEVAPPPFLAAGHVTFGSVNKYSKVTPEVRAAWGRILAAVPESRLLLVCPGGGDAEMRERVRAGFAAAGAPAERVDPVGEGTFEYWLGLFAGIDICLDPFPYRGGTTTLLSEWMGCPVVTMGDHRSFDEIGRRGCADVDEYVAAAVALARDGDEMARRRAGIRAHRMGALNRRRQEAAWEVDALYRMAWRRRVAAFPFSPA